MSLVKRNRESISPAMLAELDLPTVPEAINQRLRQVYAELPEGESLRRRGLPLRRRFYSCSE